MSLQSKYLSLSIFSVSIFTFLSVTAVASTAQCWNLTSSPRSAKYAESPTSPLPLVASPLPPKGSHPPNLAPPAAGPHGPLRPLRRANHRPTQGLRQRILGLSTPATPCVNRQLPIRAVSFILLYFNNFSSFFLKTRLAGLGTLQSNFTITVHCSTYPPDSRGGNW